MFSRLFLPTLLSALLLSSLLKASLPQVVQAGEDPEEEAGPLMMEEVGRFNPHEKGSSKENHEDNKKGSVPTLFQHPFSRMD